MSVTTITQRRDKMRSSEFSRLHPFTLFMFFAILAGAGAFVIQPVFIALSLCGAACFALRLCGRAVLKKAPLLLIPLFLAGGINVLFNHRGVTVLAKLPSGNAVTLEALIYGLLAGCMLCGAMIWFYCFGKLFTSDRLMCLTGRFFPALTVIISMTVRFIPLFVRRFREISEAQSQLGFGYREGSIPKRLRNLARIFSILISRSLEDSITAADSMRSRGYGLSGRSSFNMFRYSLRDAVLTVIISVLGGYVIFCEIKGVNSFTCYPRITFAQTDLMSVIQFSAFGLLCFLPVIFELTEDHKWRSQLSEI